MPVNYLQTILERKKREVALLPEPSSFRRALRQKRLAIIAEIKRKSPSKGVLNAKIDPALLAKQYCAGGAAAISVLTDQEGFGGTLDDLKRVIEACPGIPVLRKDFIIDLKQLYETARAGAHAALLIAAALGDRLPTFIQAAKEYGLETLVEVHDRKELERAISAGAEVIGVNNRDLTTFEITLDHALSLASHFPPHVIKVAESGIENGKDAHQMRSAGYDAVLVGEALVRSSDPAQLIEEMSHVH